MHGHRAFLRGDIEALLRRGVDMAGKRERGTAQTSRAAGLGNVGGRRGPVARVARSPCTFVPQALYLPRYLA